MEFKVGDYIQVIDDTLEGVVTEIVANQVWIKDKDDFIYQYHSSQIVKIPQQLDIDTTEIKQVIQQENAGKGGINKLKSSKAQHIPEVDLHIHELTASTKNMTDFQMLQLQLETAEKRLVKAIENKEKRLVFIHGVGKGKLKNELSVLFHRYRQVEFYDADFQKYGFGATEVYIFENIS